MESSSLRMKGWALKLKPLDSEGFWLKDICHIHSSDRAFEYGTELSIAILTN